MAYMLVMAVVVSSNEVFDEREDTSARLAQGRATVLSIKKVEINVALVD